MLATWSSQFSPAASSSSLTRSSHLSVLTAASSVPSSPPSPSGSKTNAFFASSFVDEPTPQPPPPPSPTRKTDAFFASSYSEYTPQPPPNPHKRYSSDRSDSSEVSTEDTPRLQHKPPARSLNADFFGPSLLPTPPPSIRSLSHANSASGSRDNSTSPPSSRSPLPALSRLFPSRARYGSESDQSPHPATNVRRDFVHLDDAVPSPAHRDQHHAGELAESPVELQHLLPPPHPHFHLSSQPTPTPSSHHAVGSHRTGGGSRPPSPPASDPEQPPPYLKVEPGLTVSSSSLSLELLKPLGEGSFSAVWLARDTEGQLNALELVRKSSLARSRSLRGRKSRTIDGTRPVHRTSTSTELTVADGGRILSPKDERPAKHLERVKGGRLVAVKMTERSAFDSKSRSHVSFVREVEVLRHISHPSIVSYLHSFSTPSHHCLVLEHIGGGELLDLVDNTASHDRIGEPLVRRIWGELCRAVAWMHSVGLVHRDIKLENILLTTDPFQEPLPTHSLIKLTDFGLSRFIDPADPLLTTPCGSDSYAAPELVMGKPYDGRETDAWACGVVLYTLATRRLPFDLPSPAGGVPHEEQHPQHLQRLEADWEAQRRKRSERKALLVRIAQGEFGWPEDAHADAEEKNLKGMSLARSEGIRRMVGRLLVRDTRRRARVADLWEDEWMRGEGAPPAPVLDADVSCAFASSGADVDRAHPPRATVRAWENVPIVVDDVDDADADDECEGVLVDGEDIGPDSVARQEH